MSYVHDGFDAILKIDIKNFRTLHIPYKFKISTLHVNSDTIYTSYVHNGFRRHPQSRLWKFAHPVYIYTLKVWTLHIKLRVFMMIFNDILENRTVYINSDTIHTSYVHDDFQRHPQGRPWKFAHPVYLVHLGPSNYMHKFWHHTYLICSQWFSTPSSK